MKNVTRHTGTLHIVERLPNSYNGNPRYLAIVDGWSFRTKVDSDYGYTLPNHAGKKVTVEIGTHYGITQLDKLWGAE